MENGKKSEGLGLWGFVLVGFTFIASITFTFAFNRVILGTTGEGLGINVLWIYLIEGGAAFICAWAFAKLVQTHPNASGGAMQYSRSAFGKFWGLIAGLLNYFSLPLIICTLTISIFRTNFGAGGIYNIVDHYQTDGNEFGDFKNVIGDWGKLVCDLLGMIVFFLAAGIIYLGINKYKKASIVISIINWAVIVLVLILCIVCASVNSTWTDGIKEMTKVKIENIGAKKFASFFMTLFFTFAGIETFVTSGAALKNKSKTLPVGVGIIILSVMIFYIIMTVLIMCAVGTGYDENGKVISGFASNPILTIFEKIGHKNGRILGAAIILLSTIAIRFNTMMNINLFGGELLEPLSSQKFVNKNISKINERTGLPLKAAFITFCIFIITLILFLIVPDIIEGITHNKSPFDFAKLENMTSFLLVSIYILAVASVLKLSYQNKIKLNVIEFIAFVLISFFLLFLVVMFFWNSFIDPLMETENKLQNIVGVILQVIYLLGLLSFAIYSYHIYHKKEIERINIEKTQEYSELDEYEKKFIVNKSENVIDNKCFKIIHLLVNKIESNNK